jgi:hypothetical protein
MTTLSRWMKTACWDEYAATFTYANEAARNGILKMQNERWTDYALGPFVKYERVNNVSAFVGDDHPLSLRLTAKAVGPAYQAKHHLQDRFAAHDSNVTVTRHESVPVSLLSSLYERAPPAEAHVLRDETFYGWRFAEPGREFVTYVARRDGTPVAAIIVGTDAVAGTASTAHLVEVLPLSGGDELDPVFSSLLSRITLDYAAVDHICATDGAISHEVFAAHGFARTDTFPLSKFVDAAYLLVCPLGAATDDPDATRRLTRENGWATTYCVRLLG